MYHVILFYIFASPKAYVQYGSTVRHHGHLPVLEAIAKLATILWTSRAASSPVKEVETGDAMAQPLPHFQLTPQFCFSTTALRGDVSAY